MTKDKYEEHIRAPRFFIKGWVDGDKVIPGYVDAQVPEEYAVSLKDVAEWIKSRHGLASAADILVLQEIGGLKWDDTNKD